MPRHILEQLIRRFGFPDSIFRRYTTVDHNDEVFLVTPEVERFDAVKPVRKGLRLARNIPHGLKPTTNAMQIFGWRATRNVADLNEGQVADFMRGSPIELNLPGEEGFVIVRHDGFSVGVGLYRNGVLRSQIPLSRRTH